MKVNKKTVMILSFCLGLAMFVTTAFADIVSKTGYEQMKDSIKFTAESFSEKLDSFTMQATMTLKDNDKVLTATTSTDKFDNKNMVTESTNSEEYSKGPKRIHYSYRDKEGSIWKDSNNDTYYVSNYPMPKDSKLFHNPFKEEKFSDVEKIIDAVVGNLKDYVVVNEKSDGSKEFSGSLSEGQIPSLVNAVSSFAYKQAFTGGRYDSSNDISIPQLTSDLYIRDIKGKMVVNKDGIAESFFASGILSGKDKDGVFHDLTLELLIKAMDINSTTITKPNLEGKKVEKQDNRILPEDNFISEKLVGKYKNNIVIEKDGKYVKIGERIVEITSAADKHVNGRYYEEYKNEYADYGKEKLDITFDAVSLPDSFNSAEFKYTNSSGIEQNGHIYFDMTGGRLNFDIPERSSNPNTMYDSNFSMVFGE